MPRMPRRRLPESQIQTVALVGFVPEGPEIDEYEGADEGCKDVPCCYTGCMREGDGARDEG